MNPIPLGPEREREALCWVHSEHTKFKVPVIYHFWSVIGVTIIGIFG